MEIVHGIDLFIIIAYMIAILVLGSIFNKSIKSSNDFFIAGKSLPFWIIGLSIIGSNIGATDYMGAAGGTFRFGIAQANYEWIGAIPAMILAAFIFIPFYWKAGVVTVPEYMGLRYNQAVRAIEAFFIGSFMVFQLGVLLWASGLMLQTFLGWNIYLSIIITAVIVGIYTFAGGMTAVTITDTVQVVIMVVGGLAVAVLGLIKAGGIGPFVATIQQQHPDHLKLLLPMDHEVYPWLGVLLGLAFVLSPSYWCAHQVIIQRTLAAKNEWHGKASILFAAMFKLIMPVLIMLPGFFALIFLAKDAGMNDPDQALPWVIKHLLPAGLRGLVFVTFIAAIQSSMDSILNSASALFTRDIYAQFIRKGADDSHYLKFGRILTIIFMIIGIIAAPLSQKFPGIFVANQTFASFFAGPTFATILLGIIWKRATGPGGLTGLLGGITVAMGLTFFAEMAFLFVAWWSFVASILLNIIVSMVTRPEDREKLKNLTISTLE
ncbi:MAG: sodium:solute symporter family protein [Calditrichia bacterium]